MKNLHLTKEEAQILKDVESGKYKSVKNLPKEIARFQEYARETLNKTRNINIRLTERDFRAVKVIAAQKGLPYQTFIGSLLHQYSTGSIKEVSRTLDKGD